MTDVHRQYAQTASMVRGQRHVQAPGLGRVWFLTLSSNAKITQLERDLPALLAELQRHEAVFETVETSPQHHVLPQVRGLANRGIVHLASRPIRVDDEATGKIILLVEGVGGPAELDWVSFDDWIFAFLAGPATADVRRKLAATGSAERHAFVGASFTSRWPAIYALSREVADLPPAPPRLPVEVTHVWLWWHPIGRCLAWFLIHGRRVAVVDTAVEVLGALGQVTEAAAVVSGG